MQKKNKVLEKHIFKSARELFLEKGFRGTSMREIATKSDITLSNIYTYYKNKDDLFRATVSDTLSEVKKAFEFFESQKLDWTKEEFHDHSYWTSIKDIMLDYVVNNRENFKLLFFKSGGSKVEGFEKELICKFVEIEILMFKMGRKYFPDFVISQPDRFIVERVWHMIVEALKTLLLEDSTPEKIKNKLNEVYLFLNEGYVKFYNLKSR